MQKGASVREKNITSPGDRNRCPGARPRPLTGARKHCNRKGSFCLPFLGTASDHHLGIVENDSDHTHSPSLKKKCPQKYAIQWGSLWHKSPSISRDFYGKYGIWTQTYGIRTPTLMPFEPFLWVGVLFNLLNRGSQSQITGDRAIVGDSAAISAINASLNFRALLNLWFAKPMVCMRVALHENDGNHDKNDENDEENSDSYKQGVEGWTRGNHKNRGNYENHGNTGCKPRAPQTTALEMPESFGMSCICKGTNCLQLGSMMCFATRWRGQCRVQGMAWATSKFTPDCGNLDGPPADIS